MDIRGFHRTATICLLIIIIFCTIEGTTHCAKMKNLCLNALKAVLKEQTDTLWLFHSVHTNKMFGFC